MCTNGDEALAYMSRGAPFLEQCKFPAIQDVEITRRRKPQFDHTHLGKTITQFVSPETRHRHIYIDMVAQV